MVEGYMLLNFTSDESLKNMDTAIKEHLKDIEYWGDLDLSKDSLEISNELIKEICSPATIIKSFLLT